MSSFRLLLGSGVSAALKQRLVVSSVTSKSWLSPCVRSPRRAFHVPNGSAYQSGLIVGPQNGVVANIHTSSLRKRNEASIDENLNRLDTEIRRVGRIRRHEVDEIMDDIKEMKKATSSQSLMIIRCCGELIPEEPPNRRTELVQQIWKTLEGLKVPMDISHYNALLRVYLENEHKFNPTEFLQDLTNKGIEPNRVTYQRLIARFCQDGDIDGASTILQHMKDKQMPINEYVFNSLILGHGQANDMKSAEGIISVMTQAGLEPNDDTYVTLMTCYAKQGDIENVHRIVKECEAKEVFLIDKDFLNVIHALAENNHQNLIDEILPYLKKHSGFNQEATNLVFRLVNLDQEESAYKIVKQMTPIIRRDGDEPVPSGTFFVKHLVQLNRPSETIIKYCRLLQNDGLNKYAINRALESALFQQKFDLAIELLEAMHELGIPVRQHYFWPLFASATSENDVQSALKSMRSLNVTPSLETLRDYVIPSMIKKNSLSSLEKSFNVLSSYSGVPLGNIASAAMVHILNQGDVKMASEFATTYRLRFGNPQLRRAIVEAYIRTKDASMFVKILGSSCLDGGDNGAREHVGMMLMELVDSDRSNERKVALLQPVLKELLANGLGLSNSGSELLQNSLGEALTPDLTNSIMQLTSSELTPKISFFQDPGKKTGQLEEKSTEELEQFLEEAKRKNASTTRIKKALLYSYSRDKNVEKLDQLRKELDAEGFVYTAGLHALFMDVYVHEGMVEEAKKSFEELKKDLHFTIDDLKILRYASLLLSNGDEEGCIDVLKNTPRDENRKPQGAMQQAIVWKLLNSIAESGNTEKVREVFNLLTERKLTPVNSVVLGPLIKAYLVKDDLSGALKEFERCSQEYRVTPWKQELFCRFIKLEDPDRLQNVMDLSTNIHGEVNSMYDLVFAFIDCGKVRQAKKILDTPGLRARNDKIEMYCQRYFQDDRIGELENLLQVTKDLMDVDRNSMYFYLLQAYCKQGDPDKALSVWTAMQEENVHPSAELLIYLATFLQKNNRPVPFVIPDPIEVQSGAGEEPVSGSSDKVGLPKSIREFRRFIDVNEVDKALQIQQRMESEGSSLSITDTSALIDRLARAERLNEAMKLTEQLMDKGAHPLPRTLRFLVSRLASASDINSLERLDDKLSENLKKSVLLNSRLCAAYTNAGRGEEFFEKNIKKSIQSASGAEEGSVEETSVGAAEESEEVGSVPVFGCTNVLLQNEHLLPEFEQLVKEAAHPNHRRALNNALWAYYLIKKDFNRAKELWESKLRQESRILFRSVAFQARTTSDAELATNFASQILTAEGTTGRSKGAACSCALDVLGENGKIDEALNFLTHSLKTIQLDDYHRVSLVRLKEKAENANKKFPYQIPAPRREELRRGRRADSSDSD